MIYAFHTNMHRAHTQMSVLTYYNKQRIILTRDKPLHPSPSGKTRSKSDRTYESYKMDRQTLVVPDSRLGVHELSRLPGLGGYSPGTSGSSLGAGTREDGVRSSRERLGGALAWLPGVYGLSWAPARGVPPRGCASVAQEE